MCRADAGQFGLALAQNALGIGALGFAKGLYALATTESAWASAQVTTNFAMNAAFLPPMIDVTPNLVPKIVPVRWVGPGYVNWNRILEAEGRTVRLYKDVYNQGGNFLRRDPYIP